MAREFNSDPAMDKALRRSLRDSRDAAGTACPDPSILAAYFDRELAVAEAERWEAHFSVCARCQEQLAVLARTEPAVAPAQAAGERAGWRYFWKVRWLAPLATAAAAAVLWVAVRPAPPDLPPPEATVASRQVAPASETPAAKPAVEADKVAKVAEAGKANLADRRSVLARPAAAPPPVQQAARAPEVGVASAEKKEAESRAAQVPVVAASRDQAQAVVVTEAAHDEMKVQRREESAAAPAEATRSKMAAAEVQKAAPPAATGPGRFGLMASQGPQVVVAAPGGKVFWRFGARGIIERSTDAGKTWSRQPSRVTVDLIAGFAPSEKVCWAIGASGTVLRTTDGELWESAASPTTDNLASIIAQDARNAAVTTIGGKTFVTTDGGQTWHEK